MASVGFCCRRMAWIFTFFLDDYIFTLIWHFIKSHSNTFCVCESLWMKWFSVTPPEWLSAGCLSYRLPGLLSFYMNYWPSSHFPFFFLFFFLLAVWLLFLIEFSFRFCCRQNGSVVTSFTSLRYRFQGRDWIVFFFFVAVGVGLSNCGFALVRLSYLD